MYNYFRGGEQYKYAGRPVVVTIPYENPLYVHHVTDDKYISENKIKLSKRLFELFGIHIDWNTYQVKTKCQLCWASSCVKYWESGEDLDQNALHQLNFHRPLRSYLKKKVKLELVENMGTWLYINGDL